MQRDLGITFIHVTHTQLEAIAIADTVVVMEKGRIKQAGPARDVYDQPRDRYVAEFLGGQNVLSGRIARIDGDKAMISADEMHDVIVPLGPRRTLSTGDRVDFAIRRDDVDLMRPETAAGQQRAKVPSRVRAIEYQGNFVKVILDHIGNDELIAYVPDRVFYRDPFAIGDLVVAGWDKDKTRMLA
jgi:putative spermidine/putrescine transport system ATP-binding protein